MDDAGDAINRHLTDLRSLQAVTRRRRLLLRGTAEWAEAVQLEDALIRRIRLWEPPMDVVPRA